MTDRPSEASDATRPQNSAPKKSNHQLTIVQSVLAGSVIGASEVCVNHPLWTIKTRMQSGEKFTLNPTLLYRGLWANAASMIPITAIQVGLNRSIQTMFFNPGEPLSPMQGLSSAFVAGVGSALVSCPTEMIMTNNQGEKGMRFSTAGMQLVKQHGLSHLYTGLVATGLREGLFTLSFLGVTPVLKEQLKPHCSHNDVAASLAAGLFSGVGATLASQGFDTVKTLQQKASAEGGFLQTASQLYASRGVSGFFKGTIPRGARVVSGVTLMGLVNEKIEQALLHKDEPEISRSIKRP